jgi:hypothetical protein
MLCAMWKRFLLWTFAVLVGACLVLYAGDYMVLRLRIWRGGNVFASITIQRYYAVPLKSGKIDFYPADSQQQTCTHSIFPQMGDPPCWYLARHTDQRINV